MAEPAQRPDADPAQNADNPSTQIPDSFETSGPPTAFQLNTKAPLKPKLSGSSVDDIGKRQSVAQYVSQLREIGIVDDQILQEYLPPKAAPQDTEELNERLVRDKVLTTFQAERIIQGNGQMLLLGSYLLVDKIGAGGMGEVFRATHRTMKRLVAIKLLPPQSAANQMAIARFQREVEAGARLNHPNVVSAHYAAVENGVHYLAMELVNGSDLSAMVKKHGPLSIGNAVNFILQAARGLDAAHLDGVVHRDIKPANLLFDSKKEIVKILDWGLASMRGAVEETVQIDLTSTGDIMGTVDYMAPEQALDTKTADGRADIYSLGCSLYYLLTGKQMYVGDTLMKKLLAHRDQPIPSLRATKPELPESLDLIYQKMVAKTVEQRYQQMSDVITDLERVAQSLKASAYSIPTLNHRIGGMSLPDFDDLPDTSSASTSRRRVTAMVGRLEDRLTGRQRWWWWAAIASSVMLIGLLIYNQIPRTVPPPRWWPNGLQEMGFKPSSESRRCQIRDRVYESQLQRTVGSQTVLFQLVPEFAIPKKDRTIKTFYVMQQPVSNALFNQFAKAHPDFERVDREASSRTWTADNAQPVTNIHPLEAQLFAQWFAPELASLPTATEWDLAAGYYEFTSLLKEKDRARIPADLLLEGSNRYTTAKFKVGTGPGIGEFELGGQSSFLKNRSPYGCLYPYDIDHADVKLLAFNEITSSVQGIALGITNLVEWTTEQNPIDLQSLTLMAQCQLRRIIKGGQTFRWILPEDDPGRGTCPLVEQLDEMSGVFLLKPEPGVTTFNRDTGFRLILSTKSNE